MMLREIEGSPAEILETFAQESLTIGEISAAVFCKLNAPDYLIDSIQRACLAISYRAERIAVPETNHLTTGGELAIARRRVERLCRLILLMFDYYNGCRILRDDLIGCFDFLLAMLTEIENNTGVNRPVSVDTNS